MQYQLFTLYDLKARIHSNPISAHSVDHFCLNVADAIHNSDQLVAQHPEDYSLYLLGEFDDESGSVTLHTPPKFISTAQAVREDRQLQFIVTGDAVDQVEVDQVEAAKLQEV